MGWGGLWSAKRVQKLPSTSHLCSSKWKLGTVICISGERGWDWASLAMGVCISGGDGLGVGRLGDGWDTKR